MRLLQRQPSQTPKNASIIPSLNNLMMASTNAQTTNAQTTLNPNHIENWSNFTHQYNELGLNAHLESYSFKQELIRMAQKNYTENDVKKLKESN